MTREELVKQISFTIGMFIGYRPERQAEEVVKLLEELKIAPPYRE
jgi:radical SAM superfamily enzyme